MNPNRPHPAARSPFACWPPAPDPHPRNPHARSRPMMILTTPEIRAMAATFVRGAVPDVQQLQVLERAMIRIAQHDAMLDKLAAAAAPAPAEPPPKVPA